MQSFFLRSRSCLGAVKDMRNYRQYDNGFVIDPACPKCRRYISTKNTSIIFNGVDDLVKFNGFNCSKCGEIEYPECIGYL